MANKPDSMIEEQVIDALDRKSDETTAAASSVEAEVTGSDRTPDSDPGSTPESSPKSTPDPSVEEQLEAAKAELTSLEDRFLRQAADFQNFRKRAIEERAYSVHIGKSQVALPIVDVLDDLRRSLEASDSIDASDQSEDGAANSAEALREGVKLVYEKLESELAKLKVVPMDAVGQPFDEQKHDAMLQQPAPDGMDSGIVIAEIQKGYMIGGKVLRHARVIVSA